MFIRSIVAILAIVLFMPIAVYLRSANAAPTPDVCEKYSRVIYMVALQRDMGVPFEHFAELVAQKRDNGEITLEQYSAIMDMLIMVYSSEASPDAMKAMAEKYCNGGKVKA